MARKQILNRAVTSADNPQAPVTVRVRATGWIAESINGQVQTFKPGEEFSIDADRAAALGANVEILKG
jgi:hypothetical protein